MPDKGLLLSELEGLVLKLDEQEIKKKIIEALDKGISPAEIILEGLSKGMQAVGEKFERGDYFLPELVLSGEAMKVALEILSPHMTKEDTEPAGKVVLATPRGDIHDIGKNIVGGLLQGNGFEVYDMGVDVSPMEVVNKAQEVDALAIGLSALVSTGVSSMAETVILLKERESTIKVVIGGAAATQQAADSIQAEAYAKNAWEGVKIFEKLAKGGN